MLRHLIACGGAGTKIWVTGREREREVFGMEPRQVFRRCEILLSDGDVQAGCPGVFRIRFFGRPRPPRSPR